MRRENAVMPRRAMSRRPPGHDFMLPHAENELRSDINEVMLRYDGENKVAILECHRVSSNSRIVVGKMYTPSQVRAQEVLSFNGFYEYKEDRWRRID